MKKFFLFCFYLCSFSIYAQILTPGTGVRLTFHDIALYSTDAVTNPQTGNYTIHQNLTISSGDTLILDNPTLSIHVADSVSIIIQGCIICEERDNQLVISGENNNNPASLFELRFENAVSSMLSNLLFEYAQNIVINESSVCFHNCEFRYFREPVIKYMNCNPIIEQCYFHDNQSAAINSAANVTGAPIIRNNQFYHNVLGNANQPQLNLGPGTATDTLIIENNHIEGCVSMSGGIAIANLMNISETKAIVRHNLVENNRYGYTQQGTNISSLIEDNIFINNNLEENPMNGGSGISIYGYDTTCTAKIRHNLITGNLWGITAIYYHHIDMGTISDFGYNCLYDNGNNGEMYALYNNANSPITAVGNYWGDDSEAFAESVIYHQTDQTNLGMVGYLPIAASTTEQLPCYASDSTQNINNELINKSEITIFPNPCADLCLIKSSQPIMKIQLFNLLGQCIITQEGGFQTNLSLSVKSFPSGMYLLEVQTIQGTITKKLQIR